MLSHYFGKDGSMPLLESANERKFFIVVVGLEFVDEQIRPSWLWQQYQGGLMVHVYGDYTKNQTIGIKTSPTPTSMSRTSMFMNTNTFGKKETSFVDNCRWDHTGDVDESG